MTYTPGPGRIVIQVLADLPQGLGQEFAQHIRDFDAKHISEDCRFQMFGDAPGMSKADVLDMVTIEPPLATIIFKDTNKKP
ncbi:MAG: hypothetical protein J2P55_03780 [Rhizobiales bacterium]|nr:hypothetical protein [Hyphomicrobiales bacterium]